MNTQYSKYSRAIVLTLISSLALTASACVTMHIESPRKGRGVVLQPADAQCKVAATHGQYALLFGAAPIFKVPPEKLFPKADSSYRLRQEQTYGDVAITILGGLFLSLTKYTLTVEECAETPVFASATERDSYFRQAAGAESAKRDAELKQSLDTFTRKRAKDAEVVLALRDGRQLAGKLISIADDRLVIEVTAAETTDDAGDAQKKPATKTGRTVVERKDITRIQFPEK